jgi:hypothetical protein
MKEIITTEFPQKYAFGMWHTISIFVDIGNMPFFKDIWEQGKMVTKSPPSCITTILSPTSCRARWW